MLGQAKLCPVDCSRAWISSSVSISKTKLILLVCQRNPGACLATPLTRTQCRGSRLQWAPQPVIKYHGVTRRAINLRADKGLFGAA